MTNENNNTQLEDMQPETLSFKDIKLLDDLAKIALAEQLQHWDDRNYNVLGIRCYMIAHGVLKARNSLLNKSNISS